jgi:7-keto-8-aminopelargonate synthetase-like enzyme
VLGASIASAKIHLSNEIETLQDDLYERMFFFTQTAAKYNIPLINDELTPIFYIGTGKQEVGYKTCKFLQNEGYFSNHMMFPTVPMKNSGMRITLTRHHSLQDINNILERIAYAIPKFMKEENYSMEELYTDFGIKKMEKAIEMEPFRRLKVA